MDGLIVLLIIAGAVISAISKQKQKQAKAAAQGGASAAKRRVLGDAERAAVLSRQGEAAQALKDAVHAAARTSNPRPVARPTPAKVIAPRVKPVAVPLRMGESLPVPDADEGETEREHVAHVERIRREEETVQREVSHADELKALNLQKLRHAVVMSEVLSKPVSLRPRGTRV